MLLFTATVSAVQGMDHGSHGMKSDEMGHTSMQTKSSTHTGHFRHTGMADGIDAAFQVMSLADMKMKDPEGKTHHIMVSFSHDKQKMKDITGDIKAVSPSGKEQVGKLMHFGGGMYAANFTFNEPGEWAITCNFKERSQKHSVHFMYPHHGM